jgi:hypothetical protein|tara:strand:+ start:51 stop:212 length:162 start_codon:yes stop_codon:yes gene_type:complete
LGLLAIFPDVSWEGHLFGLIADILGALLAELQSNPFEIENGLNGFYCSPCLAI